MLRASFLMMLAGAGAGAGAAPGEGAALADNQRRAAQLADIGRIQLELGTAKDTAAALQSLVQAAKLDPANIDGRFWLGMARLRAGGLQSEKPLDPEVVGRAGLEFEAVFRLATLDRSAHAQDLRARAILALDLCAKQLPPDEKRFGPWWRKRRAELFAEQPTADLVHLVARGDSLSAIARRYYGDAQLVARIAEANPGLDPRQPLKIGQLLTIPGVRLPSAAPRPTMDQTDQELAGVLTGAAAAAERRAAAARLAERDCKAALPLLAGALRSDESGPVRAECARALGQLASADGEPALCAALRSDPWPSCRLEAARALQKIGGRGALAAELAALDDASPAVAAAAARGLGRLGQPEASGPLVSLLAARSELVRRSAAAALADLHSREALAAADRARLEDLAAKGPAEARAAAARSLARIDPDKAAPILAGMLESGDESVRRAGAEAFAELAASKKPPALEAKTLKRLEELAAVPEEPATALGAALAVARARKGAEEGRGAQRALAGLLDENRAIYWGESEEPEAVSVLACKALVELTGQQIGADRLAWEAWLEKNSP